MKTKILFGTLLFAQFVIGCKNNKKAEEHEILPPNTVEMNDDQIKMAGIQLGQVEMRTMQGVFKTSGLVSVPPQNMVSISACMGGFVKSTDLMQGSQVSKGQVLAVIENTEFVELQQNYLESKSRLVYAETEYNRQNDLYKGNASSEKTLQQANSEFQVLKAKVQALEQKLAIIGIDAKKLDADKISRTVNVVSPINGYVKAVNINIGKYINPTDVMFEIVNNQKLILEITVFEDDLDNISIGQKIRFTLPNSSSKEQTAIIYQIGKSVNDDKTIKVYASVDNENKELITGMYVNAFIETSDNSVTVLPDEAVQSFDDKNYIFIYKEKKKEGSKNITLYEMIEVKKGISANGYTEVILPEGFNVKDSKVVFKGAYDLLSVMKNAGDMAC